MGFADTATWLSLFIMVLLGIYGIITQGIRFRYWLLIIILLFLVVGLN